MIPPPPILKLLTLMVEDKPLECTYVVYHLQFDIRQFAADVVGCNLNPNTNMVAVVDTWNLDQGRGNVLDATQDVELFSGDFASGRITCT